MNIQSFRFLRAIVLLGLIALSLSMLLASGVNAHEDPAEAEKRQRLSNLLWFRSQYRGSYLFRNLYPNPLRPELLRHYPEPIVSVTNKLHLFGTSRWDPSK